MALKAEWKVDLTPAIASVVIGLRNARDLIQQAQAIIENLPEGTNYEEMIDGYAESTRDLGSNLDELSYEIERGCN